jgi:archaellin
MLKEKLNPAWRGWIKIYGILPDGSKVVLADQHNAVVANALTVMAKALGGDLDAGLNRIKVKKAGVTLSNNSSALIVSYPASNEVQFNGRFIESSFNDTFDEITLESTVQGMFSQVVGLSINKDNTMQMEIEWKLTIDNL